jgi:hypothetical protein
MAAISQKIGNLIGGVSQQPDTNKFNGQLRSCDNFYPDTALGLTKRPGLRGISKLANAVADGTWFPIFRDDQEKYIVQFSKAGALKIWSANSGLQQTVNAVAAESVTYATHTSADELQTLQINDYIFVLNRTKTVEAGTAAAATQASFGFVTINTVAYSSNYRITLDNVTNFDYATPLTSAPPQAQLNVKDIVDNLAAAVNTSGTYVASAVGNTIFIRRANNGNFALSAVGGNAGTSITAFKGSVTSAAQLPKLFFKDWKIKVEGSTDSGTDDYWVKFVTSDGTSTGAGFWEETIAPGVIQDLNATTMPHVIIREANGTFTYRQLDLASAGSAGPTSISGISTSVTIASATSAGHVVGEVFAVNGGTGNNLRLSVDKVQTNTSVVSSAANSSSYIKQTLLRTVTVPSGRNFVTTYIYNWTWFFNGVQIGVTDKNPSTNPLVIGNTIYYQNGAFQSIGNEVRAGITANTTVNGVISAISIVQAGQGYTATNLVSNTAGDTFTIASVTTAPVQGDFSRLKYWKNREIGDAETNPMPSFVGYPIDLISFYKNRIVFASRQNVICSQAGDYFNFFASTVITIVDSDPVDISASTLKPIRLKHAISTPQGLLLFGDNAQMLLSTTTEAFSPKTAEINLLSTLNQTDRIAPVDIGSSYIFVEEGLKASSIYEMSIADINTKPQSIELTRPLPSYIPAAIVDMQVSQSAGTLALLSKQETRNLYLYRWFNLTGDNRVSGWFRWIMPSDVEFFTFDHDILFVVTKHGSNYVLSRMSLLTDTPSESLLFEGQYLDVRLDLFDYNPTRVYNSGTDLTRICFKDGFEDTNLQPVLMFLNADVAGYFEEQTLQYDATAAVGQKYFLTVEGNQTTAKFALGYKYEALAQLPAFYVVKDERGGKDTLNVPRITRIKVNSHNSGPYKAVVRSEGREDFTLELPQINADYYLANNVPIIRNAQSTVPVLAKGDQFEFELIADNPFPTAFTSLDWEGTYDNKGIKSV